MNAESHRILRNLAEGQTVLDLEGGALPARLRQALAEGANALDRLARLRAILLDEPDAVAEALAPNLVPSAAAMSGTLPEPLPLVAALAAGAGQSDELASADFDSSSEAAAPGATRTLGPTSLAADRNVLSPDTTSVLELTPCESAPCESASDEQQTAQPAPALPRPEPSAVSAAYADDIDSAPLAAQTDDPDADGWRPSEDAMLIDEFVGLGLTLDEVAENHGRSARDIAIRLSARHGIAVDVPPEPLGPSEPPASAAVSVVPAAQPAACGQEAAAIATNRVLTDAADTALAAAEPAMPLADAPATGVAEPAMPLEAQPAPVACNTEPALEDYEAVITREMSRAAPDAVRFATGVLKHMDRDPTSAGPMQDYLQTPKARAKLTDRLRLALLAKVVARLRAA